jgi:hypothetical protein
MKALSEVLDRHLAKEDKSKSHAALKEIEDTGSKLAELEALVKHRLPRAQLRFELSMLRLEMSLLLLELRVRESTKLPKSRAEAVADFMAALRRPH